MWCDAVCRAHGLPTRLDGALWQCTQTTPQYYPNAVTLQVDARGARAVQMAALGALSRGGLIEGLSIKDSFATLDLAPLGFSVLFEATWIACAPGNARFADAQPRWSAVQTPAQLTAWEAAWWANEGAPHSRIFRPALLDDPDVFFQAARRDGRIVAGGILNRTETDEGTVVGLSNAFAAVGEDGKQCWLALAACAAQVAPGCAIVGYETGEALAWAVDAGFTPLHPLRVWARNPES